MKLAIDIVSDVICPWCFIGKRRFEKALRLLPPEVEIEVHWRPYELNPDMPAEGIDRKLYRTRKFGSWEHSQALDAQVAQAGAGEGIPVCIRPHGAHAEHLRRAPADLAGGCGRRSGRSC